MGESRYTVSEIVEAVFCEQKVVFDARFGKTRPAHVAAKAAQGTFEHLRFELEGYTASPGRLAAKIARSSGSRASDRRCFVASFVYGNAAWQTEHLRQWRDRVLMPTFAGRVAVWLYYAISPAFVTVARHCPPLGHVARRLLDVVVSRTGGKA